MDQSSLMKLLFMFASMFILLTRYFCSLHFCGESLSFMLGTTSAREQVTYLLALRLGSGNVSRVFILP
jgi:hypothetical protein